MERKGTVMVFKKSARKTQERRWKNKRDTGGRDLCVMLQGAEKWFPPNSRDK